MRQITGGQIKPRFCLMAACCCFLAGCATHEPARRTSQNDPYQRFGKWYIPIADSAGFVETGIASWYGHDFNGKRTSSGEVYDMHGMTAAHTILPLGTHVAVINLENGRSVIVRVNDRGPFVEGRVIDLSYEAASRLGIAAAGTGRVVVVALDKTYEETLRSGEKLTPSPPDVSGQCAFSLQVGSFTSQQNAEELKAALRKKYDNVYITVFSEGPQTFYRVRVGQYATREEGESALRQMSSEGFENIKLVTTE